MALTGIWLILFLIVGGIVGGILSSLASMASLASYPALLMAGVPPVFANVTNDAALIWNSLGATWAARRELHGYWKETGFFAIFTVLGSVLGCFLLLAFPGKVFEKVVPFFIAFSGVMILIPRKGAPAGSQAQKSRWVQALQLVALLFMGAYSGYFGAAAGVIVLVLLNYLTPYNFLVINAIKNVIAGLANLTALIIFMFASTIYWDKAIPLAIGMFIGGYLGPVILRHVPIKAVRRFIAVLAFIQAGYYFYTAYIK